MPGFLVDVGAIAGASVAVAVVRRGFGHKQIDLECPTAGEANALYGRSGQGRAGAPCSQRGPRRWASTPPRIGGPSGGAQAQACQATTKGRSPRRFVTKPWPRPGVAIPKTLKLEKPVRRRNLSTPNAASAKVIAIMSGRGKGKSSGKKAMTKSAKAGLQFPVGRVARYLKKGRYAGACHM